MTKAAEMARVSAKGGFHLLWGLVVSTVISAVGTIIIARLLGEENYGLYYVALAAPNLISTFRDWGINNAMIKYSAQYNNENSREKIRSVFLSGLLFEIALGLILSIFSFSISGVLAQIFNRPGIAPLIQIASFFILTTALVNAATAAFTGMEIMHLNSIMLVIQSIAKTGLIIALVLLGLGTLGAVTGFTISALIAGLTGTFLMFIIYRSLPRPTNGKLDIILTTRTMLKYGLPLSVVAILTGFLTQFYNYILAIYVTNNATIGNYSVALNFVVLITFFAVPVTTMLFPAFSKCDYKKDYETLKNVFQYSVKYAALIVVPVTAMVIALAQPAIETLFQERYTQAPLFLALLSVTYLYSAFGSLSIANLINGQGDTSFNLKMTILTTAIGFPLSFILISSFGVNGLIITTLVVGLPALFIGLRFISRNYRLSVDWVSSLKILFSSALAAVLTFFIITKLPLHQINLTFGSVVLPISIALQQLVVGIIVFPVIFIISAILTRTISRNDIVSLREIADELGPLRKPVQGLLGLMERLIIILHLK